MANRVVLNPCDVLVVVHVSRDPAWVASILTGTGTQIGTGFSDESLASLTAFFKDKELVVDRCPYNVIAGSGREEPDVWLTPGTVWEVKAADLSISPVSQAAIGLVDPHKGIALRFPR